MATNTDTSVEEVERLADQLRGEGAAIAAYRKARGEG